MTPTPRQKANEIQCPQCGHLRIVHGNCDRSDYPVISGVRVRICHSCSNRLYHKLLDDRKALADAYRHLTMKQIGQMVGCTPPVVGRALDRHGITRDTMSEAKRKVSTGRQFVLRRNRQMVTGGRGATQPRSGAELLGTGQPTGRPASY